LALRDALETSVAARVHGYALRSLPDVPAVVVAGNIGEKDLEGVGVRAERSLGALLGTHKRLRREGKPTISPLGSVELVMGCSRGIAYTRARQAVSQKSTVVKVAIATKVAIEFELRSVLEKKEETVRVGL
jgi:hypothetical protein